MTKTDWTKEEVSVAAEFEANPIVKKMLIAYAEHIEADEIEASADGWKCIRCGDFVDVCPKCANELHENNTHSPDAADSGRIGDEMVEAGCRASYESDGNSKWEKLLDCWKEKYRKAMRAALEAALAAQGRGEGDAVTAIIRHVCETDPADPDKPDTVCIDVALLRSIVEQHITAPPAGVLYGCLMVQEAACVPHVHPEHGVGWFFSDRDVIEAGLVTQGHGEANAKHERELGQLIDERDRREEIIDCLCDAVLGQGRPEWSSAYGYDDALREVQDAMFAPPASTAGVPDGWTVKLSQLHDGYCVDSATTSTLVERGNNLYAFFRDLLAAAPFATPEGGEVEL